MFCTNACRQVQSWIFDDNSTDGSSEFIQDLLKRSGYDRVNYRKHGIGNSTYCINKTLQEGTAKWIYKVDNDINIPEGAFEYMMKLIPKNCGFMMMKETNNFPYFGQGVVQDVSHIGGVGLFRRDAFEGKLIKTDRRFFGFTDLQSKSTWKKCLCDSGNTNLELVEWYSRTKEYANNGWGRLITNTKSIWN